MTSDDDATREFSPDQLPGLLAGRYRIGQAIGHGGMANVYRARDLTLGRDVAVKLYRTELADETELARRASEIGMLASFVHPALVSLFDAATGDDGAHAFIVMELVDGEDLGDVLAGGSLPPSIVGSIGADVADALAYIHERGIVHRDVKPANILLITGGRTPRAKLADFGIARLVDQAKLTAAGTVLGTATYVSPEQAAGAEPGAPTDVYSLGLVLLEALTGTRAFSGTAAEAIVARLSSEPVVPATLDPEWAELLSRMTARSPDDRPTAVQVAARIRELPWRARTVPLPAPAGQELSLEPDAPTERMAAPASAPARASTTRLPVLIAVLIAVMITAVVGLTLVVGSGVLAGPDGEQPVPTESATVIPTPTPSETTAPAPATPGNGKPEKDNPGKGNKP